MTERFVLREGQDAWEVVDTTKTPGDDVVNRYNLDLRDAAEEYTKTRNLIAKKTNKGPLLWPGHRRTPL